MLTAVAVMILIVLIVIAVELSALRDQVESLNKAWTCPECHGSGDARDLSVPEERCHLCFGTGFVSGEMNRWLAQIKGTVSDIHDLMLERWKPDPPA